MSQKDQKKCKKMLFFFSAMGCRQQQGQSKAGDTCSRQRTEHHNKLVWDLLGFFLLHFNYTIAEVSS